MSSSQNGLDRPNAASASVGSPSAAAASAGASSGRPGDEDRTAPVSVPASTRLGAALGEGVGEGVGDAVGEDFGRYRITGTLGRGGMGTVYAAEDGILHRRVAVKVLSEADADADDPAAGERLLREARAAAGLSHPNVVQVYDAGLRGRTPFVVLELVGGGSAAGLLHGAGRLPWDRATCIALDACRGLAAAHAAGVIHRDIKPGNILLAGDGSAKLGDFGLARLAGRSGSSRGRGGAGGAGGAVGTAHYMSPEQARCEPADARSDIYSLGATYFALLTGRPPFEADSPLQVMFAHNSLRPPDPRRLAPDLPAGCGEVVAKAMAKQPFDRYQTADEMAAALEALLRGPSPRPVPAARRRWLPLPLPLPIPIPVPVAVVVVVAVGGSAALLSRSGETAPREPTPTPAAVAPEPTAATARIATAPVPPASIAPPAAAPPPAPDIPDRLDLSLGDHAWPTPAFSPDGRRLAAADAGYNTRGGVTVWDLATGEVALRALADVRVAMSAAAFSPDGRRLAVGAAGGRGVWLLDASDGRILREWRMSGGHADPTGGAGVEEIAFAPDGRSMLVGLSPWGSGGASAVLLPVDGGPPVPLRAADAPAGGGVPEGTRAVAISADGSTLATGGVRGGVRLWTRDGRPLGSRLDAGMAVRGLAFPGGGSEPVVVGDRGVERWTFAPSGGPPKRTKVAACECRALSATADGRRLAWAAGTMWVWDTASAGGPADLGPLPDGHYVSRVAVSPAGDRVAFGGEHGGVHVRRWPDGAPKTGTTAKTGRPGKTD